MSDGIRHREWPARAKQPETRPHGSEKQREIRFSLFPHDQADRAQRLLSGLDRLASERGPHQRGVSVRYDITDYTLEGIESALRDQGFHLDNTLYAKLMRALIHFCEDTELRNLRSPERLIKKSNEVYIKAWEHHPHGDHDDMPPELRDYR
jgi:hypothetical protein